MTTVGRIFQDRPFSVGGQIGPAPQMIPVSVTIEDLSDKRTKTYHARVINHPLLTGALALSVAGEAILEVHGTPGDAVAYVTTDVDADQVGHIVRKNVFFDPLAVNSAATGDLSDIVGMLSSNPFYQLNVRSVNMTVRIQDAHPTAEIDHIVVPRTTYQPGDVVNVGVVLRPYKKDPVVKNVSLTIPANVPDGTVILSVRGGASASAPTLSLGAGGTITLGHSGDSGMPPPATVQQVVKQYLQEPENNDLVASISLPTGAPVVDGEKLSLLPPTMAAIMRESHASALHLVRDSVKITAAMPYVLTGDQTITLTIRAQDNFDRSTTSDSGSGGGSGAGVGPLSIPPSGGSSSSTTTTTIASAGGDGSIGGISDTASADSDESAKLLPEQTGDNPAPAPAPMPNPGPAPTPNPEPTPSPTPAPGGGALPPTPPLAIPDASSSSSSTTTTTTSSADDSSSGMDSSGGDFDSSPDESSAPAPVERVASIWRENTEAAFDNGTLDGVAVTSAPDVRLAPKFDLLGSTSATYVWSQAYDPQGNLYLGTGDDGLIYKIAPNAPKDAPPTLLARTGQLEVTALAFNPITGDLYAATAPHGMVFRVTPDGKSKLMAQTPDPYIPAMLLDQSGKTLYLATGGGKGRIYSLDLNAPTPTSSAAAMAAPKPIFTSPDVHLLCLAQGPDGLLYAGGNPNGVVYKIDPAQAMNTPESAKEQVVYDSPTATVSAIAVDGANRLFVGTAGTGAVYRVNLTAAAKSPYSAPQIAKTEIAKTADFVSGMTVDNAGNIWASSGDTLYRITPNVRDSSGDDVVTTFPSDPQVSYASIAASPFSGAVSAGTASIAAVYGYGNHGAGVGPNANAQATTGTYVSAIHDALLKSRWGVATWSADAASGGTVALQTRTGDVALPDKTWSDWSSSMTSGAGSRITSPPARFIQYRAILTAPNASSKNAAAPDSGASTLVKSVSVYYMPQNRPPTVRLLAPSASGAVAVNGQVAIRWSGTDPDRDTLEYRVYASQDGGQTWAQLNTTRLRQTSAPAGAPVGSSADTRPGGATPNAAAMSASERTIAAELAKHPEISASMRQAIIDAQTQALEQAGRTPGTALSTSSSSSATFAAGPPQPQRASTFTWDTSQVPDGTYLVKVVADDAPSNPGDSALSAEAVSQPFTVDNSAPAFSDVSFVEQGDNTAAKVTGNVGTTGAFVKAVQYKVDNGGWLAAQPTDGLFDSNRDGFQFTANLPGAGPHHITIEAFDRAGNMASTTVDTK